jgi:hypothetical protein
MYWKPVDLEQLKDSPEPEPVDGLAIFKPGDFELHYSGQWSGDKMNGRGELYSRKQVKGHLHNIYKTSGTWSQNRLNIEKNEDGTDSYHVILVDDQLAPLKDQATTTNIMSQVDVESFNF